MENTPPTNPYAAPVSQPTATSPSLSGAPTDGPFGPFRDNRTLAKTVIILLCIGFAAELATYGFLGYEFLLLTGPAAEDYFYGESDFWLTISIAGSAILQILVYLTIIVFFAIWINRSCKNAWLFDSADRPHRPLLGPVVSRIMTVTPGWAVGWYFIPIANLWKPYGAMSEIRNASGPGKMTAILPLWWALWISANLIGNISMRLPTDTIEEYTVSSVFDLVTAPVSLASNLVAVFLVSGITKLQEARRPTTTTES